MIVILFALFFFFVQVFEYVSASFAINDSVFGSCFYMLTGFHGLHVFAGGAFLIVCFIRFLLLHFTRAHHFGFEASI